MGEYSVCIICMRCAVGVDGFSDVEAPEDSCDCNEEGLFGYLLAGTDSSSPTEGGVSLLIGVCEVACEVSVGVEGMGIRVIFRVVIDLGLA